MVRRGAGVRARPAETDAAADRRTAPDDIGGATRWPITQRDVMTTSFSVMLHVAGCRLADAGDHDRMWRPPLGGRSVARAGLLLAVLLAAGCRGTAGASAPRLVARAGVGMGSELRLTAFAADTRAAGT